MYRFVLILLVSRIALDAFNGGQDSKGVTTGSSESSPATLIGVLFVVVALVALSRWALGNRYRPASLGTKGAYLVCAAAFLSVPASAHPRVALIASMKILAGVLMFGILEQILPGHPERVRGVLKAVLWSAPIPLLCAAYQLVTDSGSHETTGYNRVRGTAVTPVSFAGYLIVVIIVALALIGARRRPLREGKPNEATQDARAPVRRTANQLQPHYSAVLLSLILAAIGALYLTYTRSAWLALAFGVSALLWRLNRKMLFPMMAALAYAVVRVPAVTDRFADLQNSVGASNTAAANSLSWRFSYWQQILPLVKSNPLTGIGVDTVQASTEIGLKPHNLGIEAYVEMGYLGSTAITIFLIGLAIDLHRRRRAAADTLTQSVAGASIALGGALLLQAMSANLLTQTMMWWYAAAGMAWGYGIPTNVPVRTQERTRKAGLSGAHTSFGRRPT